MWEYIGGVLGDTKYPCSTPTMLVPQKVGGPVPPRVSYGNLFLSAQILQTEE